MQRKSKWQRVPGAFKRTLDSLGGIRRYRCTGCNRIQSGRPVVACTCGRAWYVPRQRKTREPISLDVKIERARRTLDEAVRLIDDATKAADSRQRRRRQGAQAIGQAGARAA